MKKLILIIIILFTGNSFADSNKLINFIKDSNKVIIKITNQTYSGMVRGENDWMSDFGVQTDYSDLNLPPRAVFTDDSMNTYIVIDNTTTN